MSILWHNGKFIKEAPVFSADDRIRLGDGVFDTMLAVDGKPQHAAAHFSRLLSHASALSIDAGVPGSGFINAAEELLTQNKMKSGRAVIRTVITRGPGGHGIAPPLEADTQIVMSAAAVPEQFPDIHAVIAQSVRRNEGSPLSQVKSVNYGDHILAVREAHAKGANEAILINNRGNVTCAAAGNVFAVIGGKLVTPPVSDGVMPGIIRGLLIEKHGGREQSLTPGDLQTAQGLYITSSIRGVMPVSTLDGHILPPPALRINKDFHLE